MKCFLGLYITLFFCISSFSQNSNLSKSVLIGKSQTFAKTLKGKNHKLQPEVYNALKKMQKEALQKGVKIKVVSAYRSFERQKKLWNRKFTKFRKQGYTLKKAILKVKEYSAIPGTSRHHWGTDLDLQDGNRKYTNLSNTKTSKYQLWMEENAHKFGFYVVYTSNKFRKGYNYESWHYTYRNISKPMLKAYLKLNIKKNLQDKSILGSQFFTQKFIKNYIDEHVLGINDYLF